MEDLSRPESQGRLAGTLIQRWNEWVSWFGFGRLAASAVAVLVVCLGALWLVRSPPPPIEASLPQASAPTDASTPTLPRPSTSVPHVTAPSHAADPTGDSSLPALPVTVHVAGAVRHPGVYVLVPGSRIDDAVAAAGGATDDGRPDRLNLAAAAVDGSRIHVPVDGEEPEPTPVAAGSPTAATTVPVGQPSGPVDLNRADRRLLETLPGIGPATADAIVIERERGGPFLTVDELERVPGVGPGKVAAIRDQVSV